MPTVEEILRSTKAIAQDYVWMSSAWHLLAYAGLLYLLFLKDELSSRVAGYALVIPFVSVAGASAAGGNFFNATVFLVIATTLFILTSRLPRRSAVELSSGILKWLGALFVLAACFYPHFSDELFTVFITAPIGLIPCPTILLVSGFLMMAPVSRGWLATVAVAALFYGLFGMLKLKVYIDILLLLALIPLTWKFFHPKTKTFLK